MGDNQNMKNMKKKMYRRMTALVAVFSLLVMLIACEKDEDESFTLSRRFSPPTVVATNGETSVTLAWLASLFTRPGEVEYVVEVSKEPTFGTIDYTTTTADVSAVVTDENLAIKQDY